MSLINYIINEDKIIKFNRNVTPKYNQCVILAGGAGSGKGYTQKEYFGKLNMFRVFDVDKLKEQYMELTKRGKIHDEHEYDLKNSEDVFTLHSRVSELGWKNKTRQNQQKTLDHNDRLPNILFDITSKDIESVEEVIKYAKPLGYDITIIWVLCNIETAKESNSKRSRVVPEKILTQTHQGCRQTMLDLLSNRYPEISRQIDGFWYVYGTSITRPLKGTEYEKSPVNEIQKTPDGLFKFTSAEKADIEKFLDTQLPESK